MSKNKGSNQRMILFGLMTLILLSVIIIERLEENQAKIIKSEPQTSIFLDDFIYEPLLINGNAELEALNLSGDGESWNTSYIIEDLKIINNISNFGIQLNNTTKYVIIKNCRIILTNPYIYNSSYAILINNSAHIMVESCTFNEETPSYSNSIFILNSQDVYIKNNHMLHFVESIRIASSSNCTIEENYFDYIIHTGMKVENSEHITILNNNFEGRWKYGMYPGGTGIYFLNSNSITISNNLLQFLEDGIDLINISKVIISENDLKGNIRSGISGYEVQECELYKNILQGSRIYFDYSSDILILENNIERSDIAIILRSVNSIQIESNKIIYPKEYAFEIINSSDITIKLNIIRGVSLSVFSPHSTMRIMQFNFILPSFSYIILGISLFIILFLGSIVYFNFRRQTIKLTEFQKSKINHGIQVEIDAEDNSLNENTLKLYKDSTKFLLVYEKLAFRNFCARILIVLGILMPFSLNMTLYPRSYSWDFLYIINGNQLINDTWIMYVISNLFLIITWLIGILFINKGAKKVLPQNLLKNGLNLQKKEKIILSTSFGIFVILWFLYYFLSMRYGFIFGLFIVGIACSVSFILFLYLPFKHKWVELPIIGVILIMIFLITYLIVDWSTVNEFNVFKGIKWAYWLLFIISAIVIWINDLDKYESNKYEQECNKNQ